MSYFRATKKTARVLRERAYGPAPMNTPQHLSIPCIIAAFLLAAFAPAHAVRPYSSKTRSTPYTRNSSTSILNYVMPAKKSVATYRLKGESLPSQNLTPLKSWTGLSASERRINGDVSAYGARRIPSLTDKRDSANRRQVSTTHMRLSSAPYGIR